MACTAIARSLTFSLSSSTLSICNRVFRASLSHFRPSPSLFSSNTTLIITVPSPHTPFSKLSLRPFCSGSNISVETVNNTPNRNPKLVNFSLSDSESDSDDNEGAKQTAAATKKEIDKSKLPPPYDPFSKKPVIEEPEDPTNLQEVFHKIRTEGLFNNAVKMFDALSKDGLTHEALELFSQIKDKGHMPDVVAHTAVVEAYANAGQAREAHKVYLRMLASGVMPNAYTYAVLLKGLASGKMVAEAKKYVVEMMGKGMRPNAATCVAVFEGFARDGREEEGREFLEEVKGKGFAPEEKAVREVLKDKRGPVFRSVLNILFGK